MPDLALFATALAALALGFTGGWLWKAGRSRRELGRLRQDLQRACEEARTDSLTGIGNRKAFDERLQELSALHQRHGTPFSIVLIDVDNLKSVNDRQGHAAGDVLLQELARSLRDSIRESDFAARIGGDEFGLLLPQTAAAGAEVLITRLRTNQSIPLSAGFASAAANEPSADLLLRADRALYSAKRSSPLLKRE